MNKLYAFIVKASLLLALLLTSCYAVTPTVEEDYFSNQAQKISSTYYFRYLGDETIEYLVTPSKTGLAAVEVKFAGQALLTLPKNRFIINIAGQNYLSDNCKIEIMEENFTGGKLNLAYEVSLAEHQFELHYTYQIIGKSLVVDIHSKDTVYTTYNMGLANLGEEVNVPYLNWVQVSLFGGKFFCGFFDWTLTGCSEINPRGPIALYRPKTDGSRWPLKERFYLTFSSNIREVWPSIPNPPSPYLADLAGRVVLDAWDVGRFSNLTRYLQILKSYNVERLAVILHVWQRLGYDNGFPDTIPSNDLYGGDAELAELGETAARLGYRLALHENYQDYYPNVIDFSPGAMSVNWNGELIPTWYNPGTGIQSYLIKPYCQKKYAKQYAPEIHRRYKTAAAYHDGRITARFPWSMNFQERDEGAASLKATFEHGKWLLSFLRDTHQGPVFSEGNEHTVWAGLVDGCEAQVDRGENAPLLVDFNLLKVQPLVANHGMGYYSRWGSIEQRDIKLDKYRAMEIAFGHAGFYDAELREDLTHFLREHNIMSALHKKIALQKVKSIEYFHAGRWFDVSTGILAGLPFDRVKIVYDNDISIWVNLNHEPWEVEGIVLAPYGFLAQGAGITAYTASIDGLTADYVEADGSIYADARTYTAYLTEDLRTQLDIVPQLGSVEYMGGRSFRIKYLWQVNEAPPEDSKIFVHFLDYSLPSEHIAFGNDHNPTVPFESWQAGNTIEDGPFTVNVPASCGPGRYPIVVGLTCAPVGRLALKGKNQGNKRYFIGDLVVEGSGGEITNIYAEPYTYEPQQQFGPGSNPAGSKVDFGKVATDGALKIELKNKEISIMAYPHNAEINVWLDLSKLYETGTARVKRCVAKDQAGNVLGVASWSQNGAVLHLNTDIPESWIYSIELE